MIYLDTSSAAKLVHPEAESAALAVFLTERIGVPLVSSDLLYPELLRAVGPVLPAAGAEVGRGRRIVIVPLDAKALIALLAAESAQLARSRDGRLATFDQGLAKLH